MQLALTEKFIRSCSLDRFGRLRLGSREQGVLVVPPVLYPGIPTLGPSILAPACRKIGVSARVHYC
jgi:hypothetical protein